MAFPIAQIIPKLLTSPPKPWIQDEQRHAEQALQTAYERLKTAQKIAKLTQNPGY